MLRDLESGDEIARLTEGLLLKAGANGRFPTAVDDLLAAADLVEPSESLLAETALAQAPRHLREAIARLTRKVEALLDRRAREIHLHPDIELDGQRAFKRLHEVSHDLLPWQSALAFADDNLTLSWSTKLLFEQEANQGAAELLFQRDTFRQVAADYDIGIAAVIELASMFGASIHATFRRYVETHNHRVAGIVLDPRPVRREPTAFRRREVVGSTSWIDRFGTTSDWPRQMSETEYPFLVPLASTWGVVDKTFEAKLTDGGGVERPLKVEAFSNTYSIFVLLWRPKRRLAKKRRTLVLPGSSSPTSFPTI